MADRRFSGGGGLALRYKLVWPLAGLACVVVLAGFLALWHWQGHSIGVSVGIPVAATLLAPIVAWAIGAQAPGGQSTREQLEAARQLLTTRTLQEWRGVRRASSRGGDFRLTAAGLPVRWAVSEAGAPDVLSPSGMDDVVTMAARLRRQRSRRLIILGEPGAGKTVLARSLIVELLEHPQPGDPVPVFLPLTEWNLHDDRLSDWMVRRIGEENPELRDEATFGPTAIADLVGLGLVMPVLDGLDALPEVFRQVILTSEDLLRQERLVITCRTAQFIEAAQYGAMPDALVLTPGRVDPADANKFLARNADAREAWEPVFREISNEPCGQLAEALASPRLVYLASAVYRDTSNKPCELLSGQVSSSKELIESHLLRRLLPALMPARGGWAPGFPWYCPKAMRWLQYLHEKVCGDETTGIAWWSIFKATRRLHKHQRFARMLPTSLAIFAGISLYYGRTRYGLLTGAAYATALAVACLFLSPVERADDPEFKPPVVWWWIRRQWTRSWRVITAGFITLCTYGSIIGYRVSGYYSHQGARVGLVDGLVAALAVVVGSVIAGLPTQPRGQQIKKKLAELGADSGANAATAAVPTRRSVSSALALGVVFGLVVGILTLAKNPSLTEHTIRKGLVYGLIMGINFAVGAWFVSWARTRLAASDSPDPMDALRAERTFAILAVVILCATFASALGLSSKLQWSAAGAITNGLAGILAGSLTSEWPLYLIAVAILAARKQLPLRYMKFLEFGSRQGVFRPALQSFEFCEDPARTLPPASGHQRSPAAAPEDQMSFLPARSQPQAVRPTALGGGVGEVLAAGNDGDLGSGGILEGSG